MITAKQKHALELMQQARATEPSTDDGLYFGGETFYDREVHVAFVNHATARALERRGLIRFGPSDPEWGTSLELI